MAVPVAGGVLYPSPGLLLTPEWAALALAASTVSVTSNALLLNRVRFQPAVAAAVSAAVRAGPLASG